MMDKNGLQIVTDPLSLNNSPIASLETEIEDKNLLEAFISLYSLPVYSNYLEGTEADSEERNSKLLELQQKLINISNLLKTSYLSDQNLNGINYNMSIANLKDLLINNLLKNNKNRPTFILINEINNNLQWKYINLCEKLMIDIASKLRENLVKDEVKLSLEKVFKRFDKKGDGEISLDELEQTMKELGLPLQMAQEIITYADTGKNGLICPKEFEEYFEKQIIKYYKVFYTLDTDGDNKLNFHQAKQTLYEIYPQLELTDEVFRNLFKTMDRDKTGLISFEEWCEFLLLFPGKNLDFIINEWKLFAMTSLNPQDPTSAMIEKDIHHVKGKIVNTTRELLYTLLCGGFAGGLSRTVTAPLERLKVIYQTMYVDSKPPNIIRGLVDTYNKKGFVALFRGNTVSISMSVIEQALRFVIIEYSKKYCEDENGHINTHNFLIIGFITGLLSTLILYPMDVIRMNVIAYGYLIPRNKVITITRDIYESNGIRGFYKGIIPHYMTVLPAGSFNVLFYNVLRRFLVKETDLEKPNLGKFMFMGGAAALLTGTITYPISLITSRIVVSKDDANLKNKIGLFSVFKLTLKNEGFTGFFKGYQASMLKLIIGQSCFFGTYEKLKSYVNIHSKKKKD